MRSTIGCAVCSSCRTLLASLDSAGGGLGRARVVSARRAVFVFLSKKQFRSQVSIRAYSYISCESLESKHVPVKNRVVTQADLLGCAVQVEVSNSVELILLCILLCRFFFTFGLAPYVVSQQSSST